MFLPNGTWIPDQAVPNYNNNLQQAFQQNVAAQIPADIMSMMPHGMSQGMVSYAKPNGMPQGMISPGMQGQISNIDPSQLNTFKQGPSGVSPMMSPPQPQYQPPPQYPQPQPSQPVPQPKSVMQTVNNNNPQSVQNFLSALHQSNLGGSNGWQNPAGMQGQGPQAGFQGFQQNAQPPAPQPTTQWQSYQQPNQPQLGQYQNQAKAGTAPTTSPSSNQPQNPSTGGAPGQPQYYKQKPDYSENIGTSQTGLGVSDREAKTSIKNAENELQDFLNHLGVYSYEYKDPKYGDGRRISPMAQELEKSDLGKVALSTNEEGYKVVDYGKLMGTQLAALALLNHKYNELESQLKQAIMTNLNKKGKK